MKKKKLQVEIVDKTIDNDYVIINDDAGQKHRISIKRYESWFHNDIKKVRKEKLESLKVVSNQNSFDI